MRDGEEPCPFCGTRYVYEVELRCELCDSPVCPICVVRTSLEVICPDCLHREEEE
ncbi:MAG: hypothetical protein WBX15_16340 [Thermoanaerobaculia bacterium]